MIWVWLTIITIAVLAYYAADQLDKQEERKHRHQDATRGKR
jgi:hypothetical protein